MNVRLGCMSIVIQMKAPFMERVYRMRLCMRGIVLEESLDSFVVSVGNRYDLGLRSTLIRRRYENVAF